MNVRYLTGFLRITMILLLLISQVQAQVKNDTPLVGMAGTDRLSLPERSIYDSITDLQYLKHVTENKAKRDKLVRFLKKIAKRDEDKHPFSPSFYYHLANIYARLKLYPQAMKYYYYSDPLLQKRVREQYPFNDNSSSLANTSELQEENEQYSTIDQVARDLPEITFTKEDTLFTGSEVQARRSKPIPGSEIVRPFRNGQPGIAYAVVLLIKQPAAGHRTSFTGLNNVGHTFVTLIKYNEDQTYISRSFGFYPQKSFPFEGSPIHPDAPATYKDDSKHDWDEVVGKFVSQQQFFRILRSIRQYNRRHYDLNSNNCTDFGLCIAGMAGIRINGTHGAWPLGSGNTPASAGQSVLEGKLINTDTNDQNGLFISANDTVK